MKAIEDAVAEYLHETAPNRCDTGQESTRQLAYAAASHLPVDCVQAVTPGVWSDYQDDMEEAGLSERSIRNYMGVMKRILKHAWVHKDVPCPRAWDDYPLPTPRDTTKRWLRQREIEVLLEDLEGHWLSIVAYLGIFGGLRRREMSLARWKHVDMDDDRMDIPVTKNKHPRTIMLHDRLARRLCSHYRHIVSMFGEPPLEHIVLTSRNKRANPSYITTAWNREVQGNCGWDNVTPHTLRHTCGAQMAQSGNWTLWQIAKFLGHKSRDTTEMYAHLMPGQVQPTWGNDT